MISFCPLDVKACYEFSRKLLVLLILLILLTLVVSVSCRGTGFGFCNAMCKLAAVLGNLIFGSLVGITKSIPILLASSVLVTGGLVGLRLPDTRSNVLMWPTAPVTSDPESPRKHAGHAQGAGGGDYDMFALFIHLKCVIYSFREVYSLWLAQFRLKLDFDAFTVNQMLWNVKTKMCWNLFLDCEFLT